MKIGDAAYYRMAVKTLRHDVRNLLGGVQVMRDSFQKSGNDKAHEFALLVEARLGAMIRLGERADLLADLEQRVTDRASLGELIEEACRLGDLDREAVQCPDEGADFPCDPELTALALAELLDNALHGSAVTVREDAGSLIVENQGGPLPRFAKDTLMVPFKGAKRQGGSSLGLPIALRAMELQDGEMTIEDRDDGGARAVLSWKA